MANAYVMRTNMSVAIVAMVNHTAIDAGHKDLFDDECPNYINTTTAVSWLSAFLLCVRVLISISTFKTASTDDELQRNHFNK